MTKYGGHDAELAKVKEEAAKAVKAARAAEARAEGAVSCAPKGDDAEEAEPR